MTLNFDPENDFAQVTDGLETVTLRRRGSSLATVLAGALRTAVSTQQADARNRSNTWKDVASDGRYTAADVAWHLPAEQLGSAPRLGDVIVDGDSQRWTILHVQLTTLGTRWKCVARNVAIAYGLDDTVTILAAGYAKSDAGALEPTWRRWKTGVRARIQPAAAEVDTEHQTRRTVRRFQIFLEEDVLLDRTHRIEAPDGTIYKVNGSNGAQRIGELQTVDAELVP